MPARLHIGISGIGRPKDDREHSQRARAMPFLAAGVVVSVLAGVDRLRVCENGVGAISLPMAPDHWGARATKAMHPQTLALFAGMASLALDRPIAIENVGLFSTKGQLIRKLASSRFASAAYCTVTCDQATYLRRGEACGKCTSCILRRTALIAADVETLVAGEAVRYLTDWLDPEVQWGSENALHLVVMRVQIEHLRLALEDGKGFAGLDRAFPTLLDVVSLSPILGLNEVEVEHGLVQLYQAHVREFDAFVAMIDRPGWGRLARISELVTSSGVAAVG